MNLRTLFALPIAVILIVTVSLAGMVAGQGWSDMVRGRAAVEAVERMRLLLALQTGWRAERVITNLVLGKSYPLAAPLRRRLDSARLDTDQALEAVVTEFHNESAARASTPRPASYPEKVKANVDAVRGMIDQLLARDLSDRTLTELGTVMPRMLAAPQPIDGPLQRANLAVTAADESLSGLLLEDRLAESLRDHVGLVAAVLLPRFDKAEELSAAELLRVRFLLARAAYVTRVLTSTIEIAGATEQIRSSLADLMTIDVNGILGQLLTPESEPPNQADDNAPILPQRLLVPWGERINHVRTALMQAIEDRVMARQTARERQFDLLMTAFGAVMVGVLESAVLLSQRVVGPLAQLGAAITRIAAGDRSTALTLHFGTREMNEMVIAVETLREAALIADATALRHRLAARQRLEMLREALGIARTVEAPARALEHGVANLSAGMDAALAFIASTTSSPPQTLGLAATAVRVGLAEMRDAAAELDATLAAAAEKEDRPETEFMAHILAVRAQVERRDAAVRGFVLPSLVALRDTAAATDAAPLRELVSDQFARIEETVAVISSMSAAMTRVAAIVHDLPLDDTTAMAA
jgi:hypothetical protein